MTNKTNVTFIGMSGAGKTHIGRQYADKRNMAFIDIDTEMEQKYQMSLQAILEKLGNDKFMKEQELQVLSLETIQNTVISPGGSVVYSEPAMLSLKQHSKLVYLDVPLEVVESRIDTQNRGIIGIDSKSFSEIYRERIPLYKKWTDEVVKNT